MGPGVEAVLCPGIVEAYLNNDPSYVAMPYSFGIEKSVQGANQPFPELGFLSPANVYMQSFTAGLGLTSTAPGTYSSTNGQQCGTIEFSYCAPPPGVDCTAEAPNGCPPGCVSCKSFPGCTPACQPVSPQCFVYTAVGPTNCPGYSGPAGGSWTLDITSAIPEPDSGEGLSIPHGTLTATLINNAGTDTVTLSASF